MVTRARGTVLNAATAGCHCDRTKRPIPAERRSAPDARPATARSLLGILRAPGMTGRSAATLRVLISPLAVPYAAFFTV